MSPGRIRTWCLAHAILGLCIIGIVATSATGCSLWKSLETPLRADDGEKVRGTYYTGQAGMKLYPTPSVSSPAITVLPLHQKLHRSKLEQGFAYVEVVGSGQTGWVDNGKLIWRLPSSSPSPSAPAAAEEPLPEQAAPAAAAPIEVEAPAAAEEPEAEPAPAAAEDVPADVEPTDGLHGADPSVFNPF